MPNITIGNTTYDLDTLYIKGVRLDLIRFNKAPQALLPLFAGYSLKFNYLL
ncbi:hypothetical protein [Rhodoferax antarcticus]|uniref:hypothetical protein n=1 Tax=Rhodoferax antarcticus TaxID=81479 RepID=UPI00222512CF|nr:hypothetical protein [Rhodoferax antarcticus]MCW2314342.1 hypothetical protein [Rhodoferax antarcticus]